MVPLGKVHLYGYFAKSYAYTLLHIYNKHVGVSRISPFQQLNKIEKKLGSSLVNTKFICIMVLTYACELCVLEDKRAVPLASTRNSTLSSILLGNCRVKLRTHSNYRYRKVR